MKNTALVTIVIPTFNRGHILADTIDSLLRQSYPFWECIIVDDGSTDNTAAIAANLCARDERLIFIKRPSDRMKGANTCRNIGLEVARGEFLKWLDSDDLLHHDCLAKQVELIQAQRADVCFAQTNYFSVDHGHFHFIPEKVWGKVEPNNHDDLTKAYLFKGLRWQPGAVLWRRRFLGDKPFLEGLQNSQEWLMHCKYLLRNPRPAFIHESLCHARVHIGSMSSSVNKKGSYYFHQCVARFEVLKLLYTHNRLGLNEWKKLVRAILWNHLFVFYKGAFLKGFLLVPRYGRILAYAARTFRSRQSQLAK